MKYLPLIWAGLWRKRVQHGADDALRRRRVRAVRVAARRHGGARRHHRRDERHAAADHEPRQHHAAAAARASRAHRDASPASTKCRTTTSSRATTRIRRNSVQVGAIDVRAFNAIYPDIELEPQYVEAMLRTRNGRARRRGPRGGARLEDRRPASRSARRVDAQGRRRGLGLRDRRLVSVAVGQGARRASFWINYDYFDEARAAANGTVTLYFAARSTIRAARPRFRSEIDALFANSTVRDADAEREGLVPRADRADRRHRLLRQRDHRAP